METEIFINGYKYLRQSNNFSKSFLKVINTSSSKKEYVELYKTKADEIKNLVRYVSMMILCLSFTNT